jgi:hypothetical protein
MSAAFEQYMIVFSHFFPGPGYTTLYPPDTWKRKGRCMCGKHTPGRPAGMHYLYISIAGTIIA